MYRDSWDTPVILKPAIDTIALCRLRANSESLDRATGGGLCDRQCGLANTWCMPYSARSQPRRQPIHAALRERVRLGSSSSAIADSMRHQHAWFQRGSAESPVSHLTLLAGICTHAHTPSPAKSVSISSVSGTSSTISALPRSRSRMKRTPLALAFLSLAISTRIS